MTSKDYKELTGNIIMNCKDYLGGNSAERQKENRTDNIQMEKRADNI